MTCRLCNQQTTSFYASEKRRYQICSNCESVQVERAFLPDQRVEINRYRLHNNDLNDPGYKDFLAPLVQAVKNNHAPNETGLDFGSGPEPALVNWLVEDGFKVAAYDPFFASKPELLRQTYHYIICCEVMEHFHYPGKSFKQLAGLLRTGGGLYCKTQLLEKQTNFSTWWYKNDATHVFFYSDKALDFIRDHFGFSDMKIRENLIVFRK